MFLDEVYTGRRPDGAAVSNTGGKRYQFVGQASTGGEEEPGRGAGLMLQTNQGLLLSSRNN